ncbi:MAG: hypothetical protein CM1200mP3_14670 [Chloroflexota bacterium]|nr:MAG: hypothetical protein CM1200mP3_14670 [Chloroflexota bacterium]
MSPIYNKLGESPVWHINIDQIQRTGISEELDDDLAQLCTDLGDLWSAQLSFTEKLNAFLDHPNDWSKISENLADIRAEVDHIRWHSTSIESPLDTMGQYAYSQLED